MCAGLLVSALLVGNGRGLSRRRSLAAGAVLGIAVTVKLWAGIPLLVVAAWLVLRRERAAAAAYVLGGTAAASVVCLPFLLITPSVMFRMLVLNQVDRPDNGIALADRLGSLTGALPPGEDATGNHLTALAITALFLAAAFTVARSPGAGRLWVAMLGAQTFVVLASPVYFDHYAAYVAPAGAVVVATAFAAWVRRLVRHGFARGHRSRALTGGVGVGLAVFAVVTSVNGTRNARDGAEWRPVQLAAVVANRGCVVADNPGVLIAADVLTRDARRGCPLLVDPTGIAYEPGFELPPGPTPEARMRHDPWQRLMRRHLTSGDVVILDRPKLSGLSPETREMVEGLPLIAVVGRDKVYDVPGDGSAPPAG